MTTQNIITPEKAAYIISMMQKYNLTLRCFSDIIKTVHRYSDKEAASLTRKGIDFQVSEGVITREQIPLERFDRYKRPIEAETDIKLYPESAVNYWKHRAEVAEQSNALNVKLLKEEHNKLLDVQDRRKEWEETADELNKELCKTQKERDELRERNAALKRQLDESNRQIEIYAKKVRNLEAELEEDGGLG